MLRAFAGEHFVEHDAEAVDVGTVVGGGGAVVLLRRGIVGRAKEQRSPTFQSRVIHIGGNELGSSFYHLRDAKIRDLHRARFVDEQVLRLDVAVDDAVIVRALQRRADWRHDAKRFFGREALRLQKLTEIHTIDKLHEQEVGGRLRQQCLSHAEVVHTDNVRVIERGERMRLLFKACGELRIIRTLRGEQFERDEAVQRLLPRLVNDAHASTSEACQDFKLRKVRSKLLWHEHWSHRGAFTGLRGLHRPHHEATRAESGHGISGERFTTTGAFGIRRR